MFLLGREDELRLIELPRRCRSTADTQAYEIYFRKLNEYNAARERMEFGNV